MLGRYIAELFSPVAGPAELRAEGWLLLAALVLSTRHWQGRGTGGSVYGLQLFLWNLRYFCIANSK